MRILIVDDESAMRQILRLGLGGSDHVIQEADKGSDAIAAVLRLEADLLLLDLGLPDIDGLQIIQRIRHAQSTIPIIVLSNRNNEATKVAALDHGADDYLTKPFSVEELLARIRVLQRYQLRPVADQSVLAVGELRINTLSRTATIRGADIRLSPREYELLHLLASHAGKVLTHRFILNHIWGNESDVQYLRIYVRSLRQKIEMNPVRPTLITTLQGVGYCLRLGSQPDAEELPSRAGSLSMASR